MDERNNFQDSFQEILKKLEPNATDFLEGVAEAFVGKAETLRDGTEFEPVSLPRDLAAHRNVQTEWWYYTGHDDSPSVNPQGALIALTKSIVRGKMKDDEVIVVADVFGDGLAQIAEVVEPSKDTNAVRELEKALKTNPDYAPPFVPANLDQRSNTVRVVLRIQKVNVDTHLKK